MVLGPNDRDETIGPNKPFRDLAHGLASRGIAVLRYEKRTKEHPILMAMSVNTITVKEETIDDAVAAVEALASRRRSSPSESSCWATASAACSSPESARPNAGLLDSSALRDQHGPWRTWCWSRPDTSCRDGNLQEAQKNSGKLSNRSPR